MPLCAEQPPQPDASSEAAAPLQRGEACDRAAGLPKAVAVATPDQSILDGITEKRGDALEAAVAACGAAADVEPSEGRYPYRRGLALRGLGRMPDALAAFERAMTLGAPGGYAAIAEARFEETLGTALPKDAAAGIAVATAGIEKTGDPELKRLLGVFLNHGEGSTRDEARARALLDEAAAAGYRPAMADFAVLLAEEAGRRGQDAPNVLGVLDKAIGGGSRHAVYTYGRLRDYGISLTRDYEVARQFYVRAAEAGHIQGMISAAAMLVDGLGGPTEVGESRRWLAKASALGNLKARRSLANSYLDTAPTNATVGLVLLEGLAKDGSVEAAHGLGVRYQDAVGILRDYPRAMKWFSQAAEAGDGRAMNQIGAIYDYGQGVSVDHAEARRWYDKAAEKGVASAYTAIGMQYDHARGVPRDLAQAFDWYRKGADRGAAASMSNLGFAYENGRGVKTDLKEAVRWYQKAVSKDDRTAKLNLANMYFDGRGVAKNTSLGMDLLRQSAEQGLPQALNNFALKEKRRPGGSGARAVKMLREAAVGGAAVAYNNLGMALAQGWDGEPDHVEASYWFRRSIDSRSDLDPLAYSESQFQLGYNLLKGRGVARDPNAGNTLILAAARAQNPTALKFLASSGKRKGTGGRRARRR